MNKEMIISSGEHDTRVAILEEDQVVEIFIERERQRGVVGNVYKGRVSKVLPGMQSSFVDIGLERDAFLYVSEVVNTVEEFDRLESGDDDEPVVAAVPDAPGAELEAPELAPAEVGVEAAHQRARTLSGAPCRVPRRRAADMRAKIVPSPRSRICSRKGRRSSSRSSRNRSARRARGSRRT
jgi:ribonuclease G